MKLHLFTFVCILFAVPVSIITVVASDADAQTPTDLYGQAILLPSDARPTEKSMAGPHGSAQFYIGDASGTIRVCLRVDGLQPGHQIAGAIVAGGCQGDGIAMLRARTVSRGGKGQGTSRSTAQ